MNKGSIVERLCSDLIAKNRDINGLLYLPPDRGDSHAFAPANRHVAGTHLSTPEG